MTAVGPQGWSEADLAFPLQVARTRGLTSGRPRDVRVSPDGARVLFLRSPAGDDPVNDLWELDVASGAERLLFDAASDETALTDAERARRERARERGGGVVAYATDAAFARALFVSGGRLRLTDVAAGTTVVVPTPGTPDLPRLSPDGTRAAYVVDGDLHVQDLPDGAPRVLASDSDAAVSWGLPDFAAAEEMRRFEGFWWSPDGAWIAATRVDENPVETWWLSDPTDPGTRPRPMRYPRAGTPNAIVTLHLLEVVGGRCVDVRWDEPERFEYLARASWAAGSPLTLLVQSRDQRETRLLEVDAATGATRVGRVETDAHWVELVAGSPTRLVDGRVVAAVQDDDTRRLAIDGAPATPPGLQVHSVIGTDGGDVWFVANDEPTEEHVYRAGAGGLERVSAGAGVHAAAVGGGTVAMRSLREDAQVPVVEVRREGAVVATLVDRGERPVVEPAPRFLELGARRLRAALLLPDGREPDGSLPVLLSPYGGPHVVEVSRWSGGFREEQWFADRLGAAVLVIDGRGTPGRGLAWEREVAGDFTVTLEDQVDGLEAATADLGFLDRSRVAIRGWSFGGMLAAIAVILRPDVFHGAVSGAPNADNRLYDTHYTERYLGMPGPRGDVYDRSSPVFHAEERGLTRPLLLLHGLADDNVFAAHSLRLSAVLYAKGAPHRFVVIPRASHMGGSDEVVVARYRAELDFLRQVLGR
ncbi:MAG: prolyl oligopeptidase family serine peptidase [Actinomycetota bacterium]